MKQGRKGMIRKIITAAASVFLALVMVIYLPAMVLAGEYDIGDGVIQITATGTAENPGHNISINDTPVYEEDGQTPLNDPSPVITGTSDTNTVAITATANTTAVVTFRDVNIQANNTYPVAVSAGGGGNVVIELDGENTLQSTSSHAGLQMNNGTLTIQDANAVRGSLTATGGNGGSGIGSEQYANSTCMTNINITGGTVTAIGGNNAAGIGGGRSAYGQVDVTISGGIVTATGGENGAGIGKGGSSSGINNITISGGKITATGGNNAAAIGGGASGSPTTTIEITGGFVTANGGENAEGIGNGCCLNGSSNLQITGGTVNADGNIVFTDGTVDPTLQTRPANAVVAAATDGVSTGNVQSASAGDFDVFTEQLNAQIESYIQKLQALIASGSADVLQAVMQAGFTLNLGNHTMLDARTCALLGQVLDMGVPVRIDFTHGGVGYRTTIPTDRKGSLTVLASDGLCTIEELTAAFETKAP